MSKNTIPIFINKLRGLTNFVFDSSRVTFKVSPRVFTLFLVTIIDCLSFTMVENRC